MVIFIESRKGTSEKGNAYQVVKLVQIKDKDCKDIVIREFFCDPKKDFSTLRFGDVVVPVFEESEDLGGRPKLVKVNLDMQTPYFDMLAGE